MATNVMSELQTIGSFTLINVIALGNKVSSTITSRLPAPVVGAASTVFQTVKQAVIDRTDAKIGLLLISLPLLTVVTLASLVGIALFWPLSFVLSLEAGLVALPWYLFHPDRSSVRTIVFSTIFAVGTQFLAVLPLYFLAPFAFTAAMVGLSVYFTMNRRFMFVPLTAWWVVTSPYWMAFHFIGFPVVFLSSIGIQLAAVAALCVAVYMWPQLPNEVMKHYAKYHHYVEQKSAGATPNTSSNNGTNTNANYGNAKTNNTTTNYQTTTVKAATNGTPAVDWDKLTEKHTSYRMKEEHKEITA